MFTMPHTVKTTKRLKTIVLTISIVFSFKATSMYAQNTQFSVRDLCVINNVDPRVIDNIDILDHITDSLQQLQPNAYPLVSQWCRQQRMHILRMSRSLRNDYIWDGNIVWLDSTHFISDAGEYLDKMERVASTLMSRAENYDQLEIQRIEEQRRAEEERARAEAARIQREKDLRLAATKDTIKLLHNTISSICDAHGVTDKARIKELKDIYYSYRAVYNRYDLTSDKTDNNRFIQLDELKDFQMRLLDSVLGHNSYSQQINGFPNTLKVRSGKDHNDVYKSYIKVYKRMLIPVNFKNIAEFNEYLAGLRDIIQIQNDYLTVIELRDTITRNSNNLQALCSKKHRDILSSYKEVHGEINTIPSFTNLDDSRRFIASLHEFTIVQQAYASTVHRIETIQTRGDSITALCIKNLSDIGTAYKQLVASSDFVPNFINKSSADYYNTTLDNFEKVQKLYVVVIGLRKTIEANGNKIQENKTAPRSVTNGYKQMLRNTNFTPHFSNTASGKDFVNLLEHFIQIQEKFNTIINQHNKIESNSKQFKIAFKDYSNIYKAYNRLYDSYSYEVSILSETDLNTYLQYQNNLLTMQSRFTELVNSMEKDDYNHRLKKVKELDNIKLIMNL